MKKAVLKIQNKEVPFKVGGLYRRCGSDYYYILVCGFDGKYLLSDIETGDPWTCPLDRAALQVDLNEGFELTAGQITLEL